MELMVEITVVHHNQSIPNNVYVTGPYESAIELGDAIMELRQTAEEEIDAELEDQQCFYRVLTRP